MREKNWIKDFIIFIISYCFVFILTNYFLINNDYLTISPDSILSIVFVVILFYLIKFSLSKCNRHIIFSTIWASFIFAGIIVLSKQFVDTHTFMSPLKILLVFFVLWCLIELLFVWLYERILGIKVKQEDKLKFIFEKKINIFWIWLVMSICWFPALLAMFPGNFAYDAWPQAMQMQVLHQLDASHPIIHTLFLNACLFVGDNIFKSYNAGVLVYSIIQGLLLSGMFTLCVYKLYQWGTGAIVVGGAFVFFAFNPIIQAFAFTMTKDVLFSGMFLLVLVYSFEMIKDTDKFFSTRLSIVKYAASVVLMCLLRNQGKYIYIVFVPFLVISVRNYRKKCLFLGISLIICVNLILGPISTAFRIEKGNMREMLSVPMQQIARVWSNNPSSITEEEKIVITDIIPVEYLEQYDEYSADPVKTGFNIQEFGENMWEFFNVWLNLGLKNPVLYLESFFCGAYQYWYIGPREYKYDGVFYDGSFMEEQYDTLKITRHTLLPVYDRYLRNMSKGFVYNRLPVVSVVMNMAFPFWLMIIGISILMYMRKYKYISIFILPIGYWGTCLLGPVAMLRYDLPLIVGIPLYIGMVLAVKGELYCDNKEHSVIL